MYTRRDSVTGWWLLADEPRIVKYLDMPDSARVGRRIGAHAATRAECQHPGDGGAHPRGRAWHSPFGRPALWASLGRLKTMFAQLLDLLEDVQFERVGILAYWSNRGPARQSRLMTSLCTRSVSGSSG